VAVVVAASTVIADGGRLTSIAGVESVDAASAPVETRAELLHAASKAAARSTVRRTW